MITGYCNEVENVNQMDITKLQNNLSSLFLLSTKFHFTSVLIHFIVYFLISSTFISFYLVC